jgi:exosortase
VSRHLTISTLIGSAVVWAYGPVLAHLASQWWRDENYSHGYLVLPFAAYLVWRRRSAIAAARSQPSCAGLAMMLAAIALFIAGQLGAELFLTRVSLIVMLGGIVAFVWGPAHLRLVAFPLAFLLFMIPVPAVLFNTIALPLQFVASSMGETLIRTVGIPVLREGNVLQLPGGNLEVVEACSGIRSLVSLMMFAIITSHVRGAGRWATVATTAAVLPIAVAANALRVAGTGVASSWISPAAAEGFFHTFTGLVMFGSALLAVTALAHVSIRFGAAVSSHRTGAAGTAL